jgi:hypothetical protein
MTPEGSWTPEQDVPGGIAFPGQDVGLAGMPGDGDPLRERQPLRQA